MSSIFVNLIEARRNLCQLTDDNVIIILKDLIKKHKQKPLIVKSLFTQLYKAGDAHSKDVINDVLEQTTMLLAKQQQQSTTTESNSKEKHFVGTFATLPIDILKCIAANLDILSAYSCFAKLNKDCCYIAHKDFGIQSFYFNKEDYLDLKERLQKNPPKFSIKLPKLVKPTFGQFFDKYFEYQNLNNIESVILYMGMFGIQSVVFE